MAKAQYYWFSTLFTAAVVGFFFVRQNDISEATSNPLTSIMMGVVGITLVTLFTMPPTTLSLMTRRIGLVILVLFQMKNQWDAVDTQAKVHSRRGMVALIVGGSGAIGRNVAASLIEVDCKVILACQNVTKCRETASVLQSKLPAKASLLSFALTPLNLTDLDSVREFARKFLSEEQRLDFLVHTAGSLSFNGTKTAQGLEHSFGSLYLGPFALSHWLMPLLLKPIPDSVNGGNAARIVHVVSPAAFSGSFHPSFFSATGNGDFQNEFTDNCGASGLIQPFTSFACFLGYSTASSAPNQKSFNGYSRAMLSNILATQELQRRVDDFLTLPQHNTTYRRLVTAVVNPGTVSSLLSPVHTIFGPMMRIPSVSAAVVLHGLHSNSFLPSSYIDSTLKGQDLGDYTATGLQIHLRAFPQLKELRLGFLYPRDVDVYSSALVKWKAISWSQSSVEGLVIDHRTVSARLYELSVQMLRDYNDRLPFFTTEVKLTGKTFEFLK